MKQLKYTPDDVEILVCAAGKDIVKERRKRIQKLIEDAITSYEITQIYINIIKLLIK